MKENQIKIQEPILEQDFKQALLLIEKYVVDKVLSLNDLKRLSVGEILVAKEGSHVVGVITSRRPGKIFNEYDLKYFSIDKYEVDRKDVGCIELIAVDSDYRRRGIARKLLHKELMFLENIGARAVVVLAWQGSPERSSQKFFASFDFKPIELHKRPWLDLSKRLGPAGYQCPVCGNPCKCDDLEMIKYL